VDVTLPRVLIVDDHRMFADGMAQLLKGRFDVVGVIGDGNLVVEAASRLRPDVILLDMSMPGVSGLEVLRRLKASGIDFKAISLTMHGDARLAIEALKAGASGFVLKESSGDQLVAALDAVLQGQTYLTSTLTGEVLSLMSGPGEASRVALSTRQRQVLSLVVQGQRVKEIATALELSPRSVESIKYQLMQELNVHSTAELVRYAIQNDLVVI
jgi:DNA-binding NarL/FixJ family response regulator